MRNYVKILFFAAALCGMLLSGCAGEKQSGQADESGNPRKKAPEKLVLDTDDEKKSNKLRFVDARGEWHEAKINPEVKKHDYDWSCLTNDETGVQYTGDARYALRQGVDVSQYQGAIDWERVKAAGCEFAILRIGYRGYGAEGNLLVDEAFHTNIANAQKAGLDVGVYIFSQAVNEEETLEEAQLVLDNLKGYELQLPVVFDPERIREEAARTDEVTGEQFTKNTVVFCEKIKEAGYEPMVYSNMVWEAFEFDMEKLADYQIWYADYEKTPQTPYDFAFWQYTEKGSVDGIEGKVDRNVQFCRIE